jgi:ABC-type amino acid transport substrate-binding protein
MTRCCGIARIVLSSTFGLLLSFTSAHAVETRVTAGAVDLSLSAPAIVPPGTAAGLSGKTEAALAQPIEIFYPGPAETADTRAGYYVSLLDLAMSKTGVRYKLTPFTVITAGTRAMQLLQTGNDINLTWGPTTRELEEVSAPIYIPLDKGILGWRIFLINRRDREMFSRIRTLKELSQYTAGQQRDWGDVQILRANGMKVVETSVYETMFQMLLADRFQYFPRGIGEIWGEARRSAKLDIEVERTLALHYPSKTYFFVNKQNVALHDLVERGLRAAIKDGSFERLFDRFNGEAIRRAGLDKRLVFELVLPK